MVAPHFKHFDSHHVVQLNDSPHGASAASSYTTSLIGLMNQACGRVDNPVFHHGAESRNYAFTQGLDWNLAMFTPSGQSRMVRMNQMPQIMSDMQKAGYLVVWNKRYAKADPKLSGKADPRGKESLIRIRTELEGLLKELDHVKTNVSIPASQHATRANKIMPSAMKSELGLMAKRFQNSQNLGHEKSRIFNFNRKLDALLKANNTGFAILRPGDFPPSFQMYNERKKSLHLRLQQELVKATTGKGQSNESKIKELLVQNKSLIEELRTK